MNFEWLKASVSMYNRLITSWTVSVLEDYMSAGSDAGRTRS